MAGVGGIFVTGGSEALSAGRPAGRGKREATTPPYVPGSNGEEIFFFVSKVVADAFNGGIGGNLDVFFHALRFVFG